MSVSRILGEAFYIKDGNVGLGTTVPRALLDVKGWAHIQGNLGIGTLAPLQSLHVQGRDAIFMNNNIGIGTTLPRDHLDVEGGISTIDTVTSNITVISSFKMALTSTALRTRVQVHHIRKSFYVESPTQSIFMVPYPGAFSGHQSNVQVFLGREQLSYYSPTIKDYDLALQYNAPEMTTEYYVELTRPAKYGDIVDIIVWPQITQDSPEEQGIVFQNNNYNETFWCEQGKAIPFRLNSNIYMLGNVGIGTTIPQKKLHVHGDVNIYGNIGIHGDIIPSQCNMFDIGSSNYRFRDLYLYGKTIDLGGTLITRDDDTGGGLRIGTTSGGTLDTTVKNLFTTENIGVGTSSAQSKLTVNGGVSIGATYMGTSAPTDGAIIYGNVGIGTALPSSALDIVGVLKATGLQINDITHAFMPRGGIIMWASSIDAIPSGWALCDGANGTPLLPPPFNAVVYIMKI